MLNSIKAFYNDYTEVVKGQLEFSKKHPKGVIVNGVVTAIAAPIIAVGILATIGTASILVDEIKSKLSKKNQPEEEES